MRTYKPIAGDTITSVAEKMSVIANETNGMVTANFHSIKITACPDISPIIIVELYYARLDEERCTRSLTRVNS